MACQDNQEQAIIKKWKSTKIENSTYKKEVAYYKNLLDTITEQNDMIEYFGSVDSFKRFVEADLAQQEELQKTNLENTFMEFRADKMVYFTSVDGVDSARWHIEDKEIVMEVEEFTGNPEITRFSILKLDNNNLHLQMINQYDTSTILLKPAN